MHSFRSRRYFIRADVIWLARQCGCDSIQYKQTQPRRGGYSDPLALLEDETPGQREKPQPARRRRRRTVR
jgi:hypothetical protein